MNLNKRERHYVSHKDITPRIFKSDFLEFFSRVEWYVPIIIFVPVIGYFLYQGWMSDLSLLMFCGWMASGLLSWTVIEYVMHRFVFHQELPGKIGARIHFIFHGVHHDYPNDSKRLVLPPAVSIPLTIMFYFIYRYFLPSPAFYPCFGAMLLGYLGYDLLHYALHHAPIKGRFWIALKNHHLRHHFVDPDKGFGVSSPIWDLIAGTRFPEKNKK